MKIRADCDLVSMAVELTAQSLWSNSSAEVPDSPPSPQPEGQGWTQAKLIFITFPEAEAKFIQSKIGPSREEQDMWSYLLSNSPEGTLFQQVFRVLN